MDSVIVLVLEIEMKLTQEQLFNIVRNIKPDKFKSPELSVLANSVAILKVKPCNKLHAT